MDSDLTRQQEAHPEVNFNRVMIRRADMQPRDQPVKAMLPHKLPDEARCMALTSMSRMRADAADFGKACEQQAFSSHCDQFAIYPHAIIGPHLAGPPPKEAGKRKVRQRDHLGCVRARKLDNPGDWRGRYDFLGQNHL